MSCLRVEFCVERGATALSRDVKHDVPNKLAKLEDWFIIEQSKTKDYEAEHNVIEMPRSKRSKTTMSQPNNPCDCHRHCPILSVFFSPFALA